MSALDEVMEQFSGLCRCGHPHGEHAAFRADDGGWPCMVDGCGCRNDDAEEDWTEDDAIEQAASDPAWTEAS